MDYEGHVFQVAATFTPLKQVNEKSPQPEMASQVSISYHISYLFHCVC